VLAAIAAFALAPAAKAAPPWTAEDLATIRMLAAGAPPKPAADPSNRVADAAEARVLGRSLFFDARLSANGKVSCASCHQPTHGFTDGFPVGRGIGEGARRTMPIAAAAHSPWQFWDGRADSLWAQALGPVENPVEHGFTRLEVARVLATSYGPAYLRVFGRRAPDVRGLPRRASPLGDPPAQDAWSRMTPTDQQAINVAFANFGKAIAAYERTLTVTPGRFDRYAATLGRTNRTRVAFSADEVAGLRLFIGKAQCVNCHNGPLFSNAGFANTGVSARPGRPPDAGRIVGVGKAVADPFNCQGPYSDAPRDSCEELEFAVRDGTELDGAFKVPSLRGVAQRAPYMHAGQLGSLDEVLDHYNRAPPAAIGHTELKPLDLTATERRQIIAFLRTLDEGATQPRKTSR
jgi:cytochrome c peroxidase